MDTSLQPWQRQQFKLRMEQEYQHQHPLRQVSTYTDDAVDIWWDELLVRLARGESYDDAERWILHRIREIEGRPQEPGDPNPGPGPGPDPGPSIVRPLHRDGVQLLDDRGLPFKVRGVDAFTAVQLWLDGQRDQLETYARWARSIGANTWCFFTQWRVTTFDPRAYGNVVYYPGIYEFRAWLVSQGFQPLPVFFCDQQDGSPIQMSRGEREIHFDTLNEIFNPDLKEYVNEDWQNGGIAHTFREIELASRSAIQDGAAPDAPGRLMSWVSLNGQRKAEWPRTSKDAYERQQETLRPAIFREPPVGIFETTIPWSRSNNVRDFADFHAMAELCSSGSVLHGDKSNLQTCTVPGPRAQDCAEAVAEVWDAGLSKDAAAFGRYTRGGLGDCPLQHEDRYDEDGRDVNPRGTLRTFAFIEGDRATAVLVQPGDQYPTVPRGDHGWRVVGMRGPHSQIVDCER
jgi:hypothetical protein